MQSTERPYRSHLRPACNPCRRRKSRCQTEANSDVCLMCRAHKTECSFPEDPRSNQSTPQKRRRSEAGAGRVSIPSQRRTPNAMHSSSSMTRIPHVEASNDEESPLSLGSAEDQHLNLHIVGPTVTSDSQVLSDYLSGVPGATRSTRMVIPESAGRSKPVLFNMVQKRPIGLTMHRSPAADKLDIIEKLLEPYTEQIIDEYFKRVNRCMPLLDEVSFRRQFREDKDHISPALLASLYAHTIIYWRHSTTLSKHRCPDSRFIWNLANEAVYSELHLSPGMSVIKAILLNVNGRPTTSLIGNGVLLGSAISMAHSLGLNHNPLPWKIPASEKTLRMKIWWALLIHDRWTSLAHGTPPTISRHQYDVPLPTIDNFCEKNKSESEIRIASVYVALVSLTDVLDRHLHQIYHVDKDKSWSTANLEMSLNTWVESLADTNRRIIIRGTNLEIPGASNLRLAYLATRLLLQRIELEAVKQTYNSPGDHIMNRYSQARRTAEEILLLVQEFSPGQLGDFWLSISAFTFPATVNFLLRCALETENSPSGLAQSGSFRIARDLIEALKLHQEKYGWDLGDICLAQHAEIVDKVLAGVAPGNHATNSILDTHEFVMPDASIMDQFFPSLWDPLQNAW